MWRRFIRGESVVASIGIAAAAILLGAMAVLAWWNAKDQREMQLAARRDQVRAVGTLLAQSAEVMLASDDVSPVRRLIADAAVNHELSHCRLTMSDGHVVADMDPSQINIHKLPATWAGTIADTEEVQATGKTVTAAFPVQIPGRGKARLEISAFASPQLVPILQTQTSVGAVGAVALIGILFVYRSARLRLRAMCAIYEALGAITLGESSEAALTVSGDLGDEAKAWNRLLHERQ